MKLNGWYRLGIVVSVAWIAYGGYVGVRSVRADTPRLWKDAVGYCEVIDGPRLPPVPQAVADRCMDEADKGRPAIVRQLAVEAAVNVFGPLALAWIGAHLAVFIGRWVSRGFRPKAA